MSSVVDNDILFKGACYGLLNELVSTARGADGGIGVLGAAMYVVSRRIERRVLNKGTEDALRSLKDFLHQITILEPTDSERAMAAELELSAQMAGVNLDTGESQLSAIVVQRAFSFLLTGDKRAIEAIEVLLDLNARLFYLCGRVLCMEQLVHDALMVANSYSVLKTAICSEKQVDRTLTICFGCHGEETNDDFNLGLSSYISDLRSRAKRVLAA
jgi:hypothetical protein